MQDNWESGSIRTDRKIGVGRENTKDKRTQADADRWKPGLARWMSNIIRYYNHQFCTRLEAKVGEWVEGWLEI
jgi:hypothetical protein